MAAVHALAYPLGGHFHIPHGLSNSLVLPHVMRFNSVDKQAAAQYAELAPYIMGADFSETSAGSSAEEVTNTLIAWLEQRIKETGLPMRLRECDIPEDAVPMLASEAMLQQRLLINNPREVTEADVLAIYTAAY